MTDSQAIAKPAARARSRAVSTRPTSATLLALPKVRAFFDAMLEGQALKDAATQHGVRLKRARALMRDPNIRREFFREIEVLRESNRARNILLLESARDRGFDPDAPAAMVKVAIEAAKTLDGDTGGASGTTFNVGPGSSVVVAGYVVKLDGPAAAPAIGNRMADEAKPLIEHEPVARDDR